jgi:hypothetical protein
MSTCSDPQRRTIFELKVLPATFRHGSQTPARHCRLRDNQKCFLFVAERQSEHDQTLAIDNQHDTSMPTAT